MNAPASRIDARRLLPRWNCASVHLKSRGTGFGAAALTSILGAWAPTARAQCIDYSQYLHYAGGASTDGNATGIDIQGSYAYVTVGDSGFRVFDVTDPTKPRQLGSVGTSGTAREVDVVGDFAYVADGPAGLLVIDVRDPFAPRPVAGADTPGDSYGIVVSGGHAYLCDAEGGLQIADISDPLAPALVGSIGVTLADDIALRGEYAFVTGGDGLEVIRVTDPARPSWVATVPTPAAAAGLALGDAHAYVGVPFDSIYVVDISNPLAPSLVRGVKTADIAGSAEVKSGTLFVANGNSFDTFSLDDPAAPVEIGSAATPGYAEALAVLENFALITDFEAGISVYDIGNPASVKVGANLSIPGEAYGVAVSGTFAYVGAWTEGLQVVDIADPNAPRIVGQVDTPGRARGLAVAGRYVFLADWDSGLQVVDVASPIAPVIAGNLDTPGESYHVALSGSYACVADGSSLQVIDISNPAAPAPAGSVALTALDVAVSGTYAFVASWTQGVQVVDISNPSSPAVVASAPTRMALGVTVAGSYAYVADGIGYAMKIIDISNPLAPLVVSTARVPTFTVGVEVAGSHAYLACDGGGLQIVDIADASDPALVGNFNTPGLAYDVVMQYARIFLADRAGGLFVLPAQCILGRPVDGPGGEAALTKPALAAWPNPARTRTTLRFELQRPGPVRLVVHDVGGRVVRSLCSGPRHAGVHGVAWDGRDDHGRPVANGTYVVRLTGPGSARRARVTWLR